MCFCFDAQNVDVIFLSQGFKNGFLAGLLVQHPLVYVAFIDACYLCCVYLFQPDILRGEVQRVQKFLLVSSWDKLAINQPIKSFKTGGIFHKTFFIAFHNHIFIFQGFITLCFDKGFDTFHFPIELYILDLQFQNWKTLLIMFVHH